MRKEGNIIFLDEPERVSMVEWGAKHKDCCSLILNTPELDSTLDVIVVAYVDDKKYNHEIFVKVKESGDKYKVLTPCSGGSLWTTE